MPRSQGRCLIALTLVAALPALGGVPVSLEWASDFVTGANPPNVPQNALGDPDGFIAFFVGNDSAVYSGFGDGDITERADLATLLGVDDTVVEDADFIIFECGPVANGAFEAATYIFIGGGQTQVKSSSQALASGALVPSEYENFFGTPVATCTGEWAWAMFDLTVDTDAPDFKVQIIAGPGQPAPDAMATLDDPLPPPPPPPACPGDFDDSGAIDSADLNTLLADFGCVGDDCVADIDGDGDTDSADLNALLVVFGDACPKP
jgi:hypothetical protein